MTVTLKNTNSRGDLLEATFDPLKGMNLLSYKKASLEVIDQATIPLFLERSAGLGALIGPHFHHRAPSLISEVPFAERFPHISLLRARGIKEPFSHGVARYAPWKSQATETSISASIHGNDLWNGVLLKDLEGYDFSMNMDIEMKRNGLFIELSVQAERPSVVGTHYYYACPKNSLIKADCSSQYFDGTALQPIPKQWQGESGLSLLIEGNIDDGFFPKKNADSTSIFLMSPSHKVHIQYFSHTDESSFQIFHPKDATYVCIEPLSASFPRSPQLLNSGLSLLIEIL